MPPFYFELILEIVVKRKTKTAPKGGCLQVNL